MLFMKMRRLLVRFSRWSMMPLGSLLLAAVLVHDPKVVRASQATDELGFEARTYSGIYNNLDYPLWGSTNITQIRAVAPVDYADGVSAVSGADRPLAREVTTEVFLAASSVQSERSALFVAWALLVSYDLFLNADNETLAFDIPCDDGNGVVDVWCPEGSASDAIGFSRSQAEDFGVRNPINLATSYLDLDFMYGRSEAEAKALRTMEGGYMNLTEDSMPIENDYGTWLIGDQRTAVFPVTFALHTMLLREHNTCCNTTAPELGYEGDEDIYQACRGWTIAIFEHITYTDFSVHLTEMDILKEYSPAMGGEVVSSSYATASSESNSNDASTSDITDAITSSEYNGELNPGADVLATTVAVAAWYAAIPPAVRIMEEKFIAAKEDGIELTEAAEDIAGLFKRNSIESIIRGAVFSSSLAVDTHFSSAVSTTSPLFKLPVDAIQRGRDHGVPTYNDAREAYGLSRVTSFANITNDTAVQALLEETYGGDVTLLDALTGALAEGSAMSSAKIVGDLLREVWKDQLYRAIVGDRLFYRYDVTTTDVESQTIHDLIERNLNITDLPHSVFMTPDITVCYADCPDEKSFLVALSDEFLLGWGIHDDYISYTLSAMNIGGDGYMAIGFGGKEMATTDDFIICEVSSSTRAECTDRQPVSGYSVPIEDTKNSSLLVMDVSIDGNWTSVTFYRYSGDLNDDEDYDIRKDIDDSEMTYVTYAYKEGEGIRRHASSDRGALSVNFASGYLTTTGCDDDADFYLLHGALILFAWLALMPVGIFFARYRKGEKPFFGREWWETHSELMILTAEMVLPLGITAIFTTSGNHYSSHARWGFFMIAAIALQIVTGILRQRALEGKYPNFSRLHRVNKHVHIWLGYFAFVAGVVQCQIGVELVSETDSLLFSAVEDMVEFKVGNFGFINDYFLPIWFGVLVVSVVFLETRKQLQRYKRKGAAMICFVFEWKNKNFVAERPEVDSDGEIERLLIPRTQALPLYTMDQFNRKVLEGMSWVIVDGAILDGGNFSRRHPGGARVIVNALGTDITNNMRRGDMSVGSAMPFTPHDHSENAWEVARSLVVGYIEEDEEEENSDSESDGDDAIRNGRSWSIRSHFTANKRSAEQARPELGQRLDSARDQRGSSSLGDIGVVGGQDLYASSSAKLSNESNMRAAMIARAWAKKADRTGSVNALPLSPTLTSLVPRAATAFLENIQIKDRRKSLLLQGFHVCPFVLRQRLDGGTEEDRAVYRYVFTCPGEAFVLAHAAAGVCYFKMRIVRSNGNSVVQRSYNATAVRVIKTDASNIKSSALTAADHPDDAAVQLGVSMADVAPTEDGDAAATAVPRPSDSPNDPAGGSDDGTSSSERKINDVGGSFGSGRSSRSGKVGGIGGGSGSRGSIGCVVGSGDGTNSIGSSATVITKEGTVRVVPAVESREGSLCIEMRIRLYKHGAMSKLLQQLPNDLMNASVQLQGPFFVDSLGPPPAHRNVIMIAAGTGINPMVQLIRDYQSFDSQDTLRTSGRSRLALLWQATIVSDLYCIEELHSLKVRGRGLLEITTLLSGDHRKKNDPEAPTAAKRRRKRRVDAAAAKQVAVATIPGSLGQNLAGHSPPRTSNPGLLRRIFSSSPIPSSSRSDEECAVEAEMPTLAPIHPQAPESESEPSPVGRDWANLIASLPSFFTPVLNMTPNKPKPTSHAARELVKVTHGAPRGMAVVSPKRASILPSPSSPSSSPTPGPRKGKISKGILREVFGESLMQAIDGFSARHPATLEASQEGVERSRREADLVAMCGTETEAGKLQVVLSGPSGFVFRVEHMLEEMGVPKEAVVILD